jgi:hypothetical protein
MPRHHTAGPDLRHCGAAGEPLVLGCASLKGRRIPIRLQEGEPLCDGMAPRLRRVIPQVHDSAITSFPPGTMFVVWISR